ncbi:MAG: hypothetical protein HRT45_13005 [Bdellovibrionales bacterium]|nr:hypothetical protein [Bdellovibrionales bacterium]
MPKKKLFRPELEDRVSHEQYQATIKARGRADRVMGLWVLLSGLIALVSSVLAICFTPLGVYTGSVGTDFVVLLFVGCCGLYFTNKGLYFMRVFQCRFCLAKIPEGSTYCPSCGADLLSNDNPQD